MDEGKTPKNLEVDTKLRLLTAATEEDSGTSKLLCEYIDRRNRGETVDKDELLARSVSTEARKELEGLMEFFDDQFGEGGEEGDR